MNWKKIVLPIAIIAFAVLAMVLLSGMRSDKAKKNIEVHSKVVSTEIVSLGDQPSAIVAYGTVKTAQPVQLYSEVAGTIEAGSVPFQKAETFKRGDLLLKIDDRQAVLNLQSKKSDLLTAMSSFLPEIKSATGETEYQKWQKYYDVLSFSGQIADLPESDIPKVRMYLSRFNIYQLYFAVKNLEITLNKHYFYAPFDGSIQSVALYPGSSARSGVLLGEIVNLESMEVEVPVNAADVQWIDTSSEVLLTSEEASGEWTGKIKRVGSTVDNQTQTVPLFISIKPGKNSGIYNGTFVTAHIKGRIVPNSIKIPRRALYENKYIYAIEDGKLARRDVTIIRQELNMLFVTGDIKDNEVLVTEMMQGIAPGMPAQSRNDLQ
ncbi:MAG: efflux RND transporter periplasmic adaptor subunit [Candidatus Zixiibacteriota bacterium]